MTMIGLIVCGIGLAGLVVNYLNLYPMSGIMADPKLLVGVAVIGAITAILTRRASD